jgi:DNA-binding PadR family transcriptional regulator
MSPAPPPPRPLKTLVYEILLILLDAERHGWDLVRELERRAGGSRKILPGNLYRTLRDMRVSGLIEETALRPTPDEDDERRRYFRVTPAGERAARMESERLRRLLVEAQSLKLLGSKRR